MAIGTYDELLTAVANWTNKNNLTSRIPEFVVLAEARINSVLRARGKMQERSAGTVSTEYSSLPTDFLEAISFKLGDGTSEWELQQRPPEWISQAKTQVTETGQPRVWANVDGQMRVFPAPDQSYNGTLIYFQALPALATNSTNWLLARHPGIYLFGALAEAGPFLRDDALASTFEQKFQQAVAEFAASDRTPAGRLRTEVATLTGSGSAYNITTDA